MSLAGKIFAVICFVAAIFYAGITAALMSLQENWRQKYADEAARHVHSQNQWKEDKSKLDDKIGQLTGHLNRAEREVTGLRGERDEFRKEWEVAAGVNRFSLQVIQDQEDQITLLQTQVVRLNEDIGSSRADGDKKQARIDDLDKQYKDLLAKRDALQDLLTVREKDLTNAVKEVQKLTDDLAMVNDMLQRYKERDPEGYALLLRPDTVVRPKKVIRGKVTGVDKPLGLVILNIGQRHEVLKGYSFIVFRGDEYIGKIIVDEVFPDMSATHYVREAMKKDVEVGDDVTTRLTIDL